ncbi:MAG: hypothetical protein Q4D98_03085 [Planctomycetia bacterium]|nr:hypothetical protein [Planctomycetia bacterium]
MNRNNILKNNRWIMLLLLGFSLPVCSGCYLEDLVKSILNNYYPEAETVQILILPPYPIASSGAVDSKVVGSFTSASDIKSGLTAGVHKFNQASSKTQVQAVWHTSKEVRSFYENQLLAASKECKKNNTPFDLKKVCRDYITELKRDGEQDLNCIIFGIFTYTPNATAYSVSLHYYDIQADNIAQVRGVVSKEESRERGEALSKLLQTLLEKVY